MAGEWCPIDCNLATKPEVLELVDETGDQADAVIGRLVQLWLWSAMNSEDGTARMTVRRLGKLFGGSDTFWAGGLAPGGRGKRNCGDPRMGASVQLGRESPGPGCRQACQGQGAALKRPGWGR